jgi:hypothetical protein
LTNAHTSDTAGTQGSASPAVDAKLHKLQEQIAEIKAGIGNSQRQFHTRLPKR